MRVRASSQSPATVTVYGGDVVRMRSDVVATEEPLEIRLATADGSRTLALTMRTPGDDFELAAGFLFSEGVVAGRDDVTEIRYCTDVELTEQQRFNVVTVHLRPGVDPDLRPLERHFYTSSACGVCGKASVEALRLQGCAALTGDVRLSVPVVTSLPAELRAAQRTFDATGGLHAAGLFTPDGDLVAVREDVGRHNALDKLVGWAVLDGRVPLSGNVVVVSGRASFELAQKCVRAGVPVLCAVSAPSSLAIDVAAEFGLTLVGFLRDERFNVYARDDRILGVVR